MSRMPLELNYANEKERTYIYPIGQARFTEDDFFKRKAIWTDYRPNGGPDSVMRTTAIIDEQSPLYPATKCHCNCTGHELCQPATFLDLPSHLSPHSFAHAFYQIRILLMTNISPREQADIIECLQGFPPYDLYGAYLELLRRGGTAFTEIDDTVLLDHTVAYWLEHCNVFRTALMATADLPIRVANFDVFLQGSDWNEENGQLFCSGNDLEDVLGKALERARARLKGTTLVSTAVTRFGDPIVQKLGKDIDGEMEKKELKLEASDQPVETMDLKAMIRMIETLQFSHAATTVVLATGAAELERGVSPAEYGNALEELLHSLHSANLRTIILPPSIDMSKQDLWRGYVDEQQRLAQRYSWAQFLACPRTEWHMRNFLENLMIGNELDPVVCTEQGLTSYGYTKLVRFLKDVVYLPESTTAPYYSSAYYHSRIDALIRSKRFSISPQHVLSDNEVAVARSAGAAAIHGRQSGSRESAYRSHQETYIPSPEQKAYRPSSSQGTVKRAPLQSVRDPNHQEPQARAADRPSRIAEAIEDSGMKQQQIAAYQGLSKYRTRTVLQHGRYIRVPQRFRLPPKGYHTWSESRRARRHRAHERQLRKQRMRL